MTSRSDDPPDGGGFDLAARRSPWGGRHREIVHRGIARHIPRQNEMRQLLFGPGRVVKYPLAALMVEKELGPARHALSQRTVAGTAEVIFAVGPVPVPRATPPAPRSSPPRTPGSSPPGEPREQG